MQQGILVNMFHGPAARSDMRRARLCAVQSATETACLDCQVKSILMGGASSASRTLCQSDPSATTSSPYLAVATSNSNHTHPAHLPGGPVTAAQPSAPPAPSHTGTPADQSDPHCPAAAAALPAVVLRLARQTFAPSAARSLRCASSCRRPPGRYCSSKRALTAQHHTNMHVTHIY